MAERGTIGIIGGGQLGRMLTLAALPLGFKVIVLNPSPGGPASLVGAEEIVADLYDEAAIKKLAKRADFLTVEIEHLNTHVLESLVAQGASINPSPQTIALIQDKLKQKEFLDKAGVPVAAFQPLTDISSAKRAHKAFGGKMLIKTRHGAYDGRGNMVIAKPSDIARAFKTFAGQQLYAEGFVQFRKELAVMAARSSRGNVSLYPIVETIHKRNICVEVLAPAPITPAEYRAATRVAKKVASLLVGAGTYGIELFLTKGGKIIVNEIAPRVHNSGHYTMEANRTSQFEQHIRAITGLPLGDTAMVVPAAVMINVLGERNGPTKVSGLDKALEIPQVSIHIYGKSPTKIDRKMGHLTATGQTLLQARQRARAARRSLTI